MMEISVPAFTEDYELFSGLFRKGIDSRLEAFTKSTATLRGHRLYMDFHTDEMSILLRRLSEDETTLADGWIDDILREEFGYDSDS